MKLVNTARRDQHDDARTRDNEGQRGTIVEPKVIVIVHDILP